MTRPVHNRSPLLYIYWSISSEGKRMKNLVPRNLSFNGHWTVRIGILDNVCLSFKRPQNGPPRFYKYFIHRRGLNKNLGIPQCVDRRPLWLWGQGGDVWWTWGVSTFKQTLPFCFSFFRSSVSDSARFWMNNNNVIKAPAKWLGFVARHGSRYSSRRLWLLGLKSL